MEEYFVFKRITNVCQDNPKGVLDDFSMVPLFQALNEMNLAFVANDNVIERIDTIVDLVSNHFGFDRHDLLSHKRNQDLVDIRYLLFRFIRDEYFMSFADIGRILGSFDHATVLRACKQVDILRKNDRNFASKYHEFKDLLKEFTISRRLIEKPKEEILR